MAARAAEYNAPSIRYSQQCLAALSGGTFDVRAWFRKAPRDARCGEEDTEANMMWRAKVKLIDLLNQKPELLNATLCFVEDKVMGAATGGKDPKNAARWPATYCTWDKVPKYWKAEFILERMRDGGLTSEYLSFIDGKNAAAVNELFTYLLAVNLKWKFPRALLDKAAMWECLRRRFEALGRGTPEWLTGVTGGMQSLALDWGKHGCYTLTQAQNGITITHCDGDEARPCAHRYVSKVRRSCRPLCALIHEFVRPRERPRDTCV